MITVKIEGVASNIVELAPLLKQQWDELGEYRDCMPLAPDFGLYIVRESQGQCFMTTARNEGALIGYYICMVQPLPHHMTTFSGYLDFMWLMPEYRAHGVGQQIFNTVESELRRRGAKIWFSASRACGTTHERMDKLLRRNGFEPLDLIYAKWIG